MSPKTFLLMGLKNSHLAIKKAQSGYCIDLHSACSAEIPVLLNFLKVFVDIFWTFLTVSTFLTDFDSSDMFE